MILICIESYVDIFCSLVRIVLIARMTKMIDKYLRVLKSTDNINLFKGRIFVYVLITAFICCYLGEIAVRIKVILINESIVHHKKDLITEQQLILVVI